MKVPGYGAAYVGMNLDVEAFRETRELLFALTRAPEVKSGSIT